MFTAELFTIAKVWKQNKCPLMDEWMKKFIQWTCTHKKNKILPFVKTGTDLELCLVITRSEIHQTEKGKYLSYDFTYKRNSKSKGININKACKYGEQTGGYQKRTGLGVDAMGEGDLRWQPCLL